jgi:hypothetical protein
MNFNQHASKALSSSASRASIARKHAPKKRKKTNVALAKGLSVCHNHSSDFPVLWAGLKKNKMKS